MSMTKAINRKVCCVISDGSKLLENADYVRQKLNEEIAAAIDDEFAYFISGFDDEAALLFAEIVIDLRRNSHKLFLEAAIPYSNWTNREDNKGLLSQSNGRKAVCRKGSPNSLMLRSRYMAQESERVIAVYCNDPKPEMVAALRFAHVYDRELRVIQY